MESTVRMVVQIRGRCERFVLLELLGRGGTAEAWRAKMVGGLLEREVCVKRPLARLQMGQRRAFIEEARIMARVRHSNIVSLFDVVEDERGTPLLVLELIRGLDLRVVAGCRRIRSSTIAAVGVDLCRALAAAWRALPGGVVHRDVSPHNVMISTEGEVKLIDFGVARALDRDRWTRTGYVKGKSAYVPPEALRGENLDARSDLFSVGVVLYELIAGRRPFRSRGRLSVLDAVARGRREPLQAAAPEAPLGLVAIVERLLAHRRDERPCSPDHAIRLLAPHCDGAVEHARLRALVRELSAPGVARASRLDGRRSVTDAG